MLFTTNGGHPSRWSGDGDEGRRGKGNGKPTATTTTTTPTCTTRAWPTEPMLPSVQIALALMAENRTYNAKREGPGVGRETGTAKKCRKREEEDVRGGVVV